MTQETWVFDSLVGFLKGPVWNVPILTFIENKSLSEYLLTFIENKSLSEQSL